jgi:hypothetical protein
VPGEFKERHWVLVLIFSIITLGIYVPFWYLGVSRVTNSPESAKKLSKTIIILMIIVAFLAVPFNITFSYSINDEESEFTTNIFGIGTILRLLTLAFQIILAFSLRDILIKQHSLNVNPIATFFFGAIYLQYKINSIVRGNSVAQSPTNQNVQTTNNQVQQG